MEPGSLYVAAGMVGLVLAGSAGLPAAEDPLVAGDAAWERRAEGQVEGRAAAEPIRAAVAAYEQALASRPESVEAAWKLMRALYFEGEFLAREREEKQRLFARGVEVFKIALGQLDRRLAAAPKPPAGSLAELPPAQIVAAVRGLDGALEVFFWGAVDWGLWGDAFGRLAAVRQGVAGRLRDYAAVVIDLDERYSHGGGHRLLGRLHALAPRVPFFTGWIRRDTAVAELERALELAPEDPYNQLYLAEVLLAERPARRDEARRLLSQLLASPAPPDRVVEQARASQLARQLLESSSR